MAERHPFTWWAAALIISISAAVTSNAFALLGLVALSIAIVALWHQDPAALRVFRGFCYFAMLALLIRLLFSAIFSNPFATDTLFTVPALELPLWTGGMTLGGAVTLTALTNALTEGLRMAAIIMAVGAASALTSPVKLLAKLPSALYEVGLSILIALTTVPALAADVARTREALILRGRKHSTLSAVASSFSPTLDSAVRRSVMLAASMESRGYGRHQLEVSKARRDLNSVSLLSLLVFGLLSITALMSVSFAKSFGNIAYVGLFVSFTALLITSMGLNQRTQYRPITWQVTDSTVVAVTLLIALIASGLIF